MLEARFKERRHESNYKDLLIWGETAYIDYLKAISGEEISAIPKELRLSYEEERAILRLLKRKTEEKETTEKEKGKSWPTLLTMRYALLCQGKEEITATISEKKNIKVRPAVL